MPSWGTPAVVIDLPLGQPLLGTGENCAVACSANVSAKAAAARQREWDTGWTSFLRWAAGRGANRSRGPATPQVLAPGIYGLSNHLLDTPWPKLARTRTRFSQMLEQPEVGADELFSMLSDREPASEDEALPSTGLPRDWERLVSAPFIVNERYGTRCSSVLLVERNGRTILHERRFDPAGVQSGTTRFEFKSVDVPETWFEAEDPDAEAAGDPSFDSSPE